MSFSTLLQRIEENDPTLTTLDFDFKKITLTQVSELANALAKNSTVTSLSLSGNALEVANVRALAEMLKTNNTLQTLKLNNCGVGVRGITALAEALAANSTLKQLGLYGNKIEDEGAVELAEALKVNQGLKALDISCNHIKDKGIYALLAGALEGNSTLKRLSIKGNVITEVGCIEKLADSLMVKSNTTLTVLDFDHVIIPKEVKSQTRKEIKAINDWLRINDIIHRLKKNDPTLTDVKLENCEVRHTQLKALSEALKGNTVLQSLCFSNNGMGDNEATALTVALINNRTLTRLEISANHTTQRGAKALAHVLAQNTSLRTLSLAGNDLGIGGVSALVNALLFNSTLEALDVSYNDMVAGKTLFGRLNPFGAALEKGTNSPLEAIADVVRNNTTLRSLNLEGNNLDNGLVTKINTTLDLHARQEKARSEAEVKYTQGAVAGLLEMEDAESGRPGLPLEVGELIGSFITERRAGGNAARACKNAANTANSWRESVAQTAGEQPLTQRGK